MFYSNKTPRCNISRALSPPTIKNINLRNTSWEILLLFNSRRISVSRSNFVTLLLLFVSRQTRTSRCTHWTVDGCLRTWQPGTVLGNGPPGCPYSWSRRPSTGIYARSNSVTAASSSLFLLTGGILSNVWSSCVLNNLIYL